MMPLCSFHQNADLNDQVESASECNLLISSGELSDISGVTNRSRDGEVGGRFAIVDRNELAVSLSLSDGVGVKTLKVIQRATDTNFNLLVPQNLQTTHVPI